MSVVEFIIALKGQVRIWLVDIVLRLVTPVWGLAGVLVCAVYLGLSTSKVPVSLLLRARKVRSSGSHMTIAARFTDHLRNNCLPNTALYIYYSCDHHQRSSNKP